MLHVTLTAAKVGETLISVKNLITCLLAFAILAVGSLAGIVLHLLNKILSALLGGNRKTVERQEEGVAKYWAYAFVFILGSSVSYFYLSYRK